MNMIVNDKNLSYKGLSIKDVSHSYDNCHFILKNFSFDFVPGKLYAFMGASGSGKSTLLHIASGLLNPSHSGEVLLNSDKVTYGSSSKNSYIFSDSFLIPELTCLENLEICNVDMKKVHLVSEELGVSQILSQYPDSLSSGQKQRVSALRAFCIAQHVLFADEPTSHLDKTNSLNFMELIAQRVRQDNLIFLCVTHDHHLKGFFDEVISL